MLCVRRWASEQEEKCSWWFYGSITNFPMCCRLPARRSAQKRISTLTFTHSSTPEARPVSVLVKMKILRLFTNPSTLDSLLFSVLLLFYYLFYDCIKWPIVKVNDSQRHKTAHFLLWLLSIILFNDKLGLTLIYSRLSYRRWKGLRQLQAPAKDFNSGPISWKPPPRVY